MFALIDRCSRLKARDFRRHRIEPFQELTLTLENGTEGPPSSSTKNFISLLQMAISTIDRKTLWKDGGGKNQRITAEWICRFFICLCQYDGESLRTDQGKEIVREMFQWLREVKEYHRTDEQLHLFIYQSIEQYIILSTNLDEILQEFFLIPSDRSKSFCHRSKARTSISILDYTVQLVLHEDDSSLLINEIFNVFLRLMRHRRFLHSLFHRTEFYHSHLFPLFTGQRTDLFLRRLIDETAQSQTDSTDRVFVYTHLFNFLAEFAEQIDLPIDSFLPTYKSLFDGLVDCGTTVPLWYLLRSLHRLFLRSDFVKFSEEMTRTGLTESILQYLTKLVQRKNFNHLQNDVLICSLSLVYRLVQSVRSSLPHSMIFHQICQPLIELPFGHVRLLACLISIELEMNRSDVQLFDQLISSIRQRIRGEVDEQISLFTLFKALKHLSSRNESQIELCFEVLKKFYSDSSHGEEMETILDLLWSISFDLRCATMIHQHDKYFALLVQFAETHPDETVQRLSRAILWQIRETLSHRPASTSAHIMISYNHQSKELVYDICQWLRDRSYSIWLDVDHMQNNTLDSMAQAIEQASIVLLCITEKYKGSANCQSEAEYAHRLNKPIVPLLLQPKYKPTGWLGLILGSKLYIDFTKNDFETNMRKVLQQIQTMLT